MNQPQLEQLFSRDSKNRRHTWTPAVVVKKLLTVERLVSFVRENPGCSATDVARKFHRETCYVTSMLFKYSKPGGPLRREGKVKAYRYWERNE